MEYENFMGCRATCAGTSFSVTCHARGNVERYYFFDTCFERVMGPMKNRPPSSVTFVSKGIRSRSAKWNTTNSGINHSFQPPLRCTSNQDHKKKKNEKYIWWHHLLVSEFDQTREKHCAMHTRWEDVSSDQIRWHRKNGWSSNIFFDYFLSTPEGIPERHARARWCHSLLVARPYRWHARYWTRRRPPDHAAHIKCIKRGLPWIERYTTDNWTCDLTAATRKEITVSSIEPRTSADM